MTEREVGRGFVHLNTPASIAYTAGHKLSTAALKAKKSRVETVQLPPWLKVWRSAKSIFVASHGFLPLATDVEEEKEGQGPLYPSLVSSSAAVLRRKPFFTALPSKRGGINLGKQHSVAGIHESERICFSPSGAEDKEAINGIQIVAHHKVSGEFTFTYPDYDGVLSNGVVPEIVTTPDSPQAEMQRRAYYVTPLDLTNEEAEALEELQMLWKSRSKSRSFTGAQMRAAVGENKRLPSHTTKKGEPTSSSTFIVDTTPFSHSGESSKVVETNENSSRNARGTASSAEESDAKGNGKAVAQSAFDDALRMVDDLLLEE